MLHAYPGADPGLTECWQMCSCGNTDQSAQTQPESCVSHAATRHMLKLRCASDFRVSANISRCLTADERLDVADKLAEPSALYSCLGHLHAAGCLNLCACHADWSQPGSFPALQFLDMSGNAGLTGPLPPFGTSAAAVSLQHIDLSSCKLTGAPSAVHCLSKTIRGGAPGRLYSPLIHAADDDL